MLDVPEPVSRRLHDSLKHPYKLLLSIMGALVPFFQDCKPHAVLCDVARGPGGVAQC